MKVCGFVIALSLALYLTHGQEPLKASVEQIDILGASGPPGWDGNWVLENGYTLRGGTPTFDKCYSSKTKNVEVFVFIPLSEVTKVSVMNRNDAGEGRMSSLEIYVCTDKNECKHCANCPSTGLGAWCQLECANGPLKGNQVKLKNVEATVDFCEIIALGIPLTLASKPSVLGGTGSNPWSADWVLTNGYSSDGSKCYSSAYCRDASAQLEITLSAITEVRLFNRDAAEMRMTNTKVEICTKGGFCHLCGHAPVTPKSQWASIKCANGPLKGNVLKLTREHDCLQFCQVDLIGHNIECDHDCDNYSRFCPALLDKNFAAEYKALADAGKLDALGSKNKVPPTPTCGNPFYQITCPKTCQKCFAC